MISKLLSRLFPPRTIPQQRKVSKGEVKDADLDAKDYLVPFLEKVGSTPKDTLKLEKALERAHTIRMFEIELFWKRATFFWTLLGATIIVFGAVISAKDLDSLHRWLLLTAISLTGLISASILLFANKGSKFWQRNWEYHVDLLEEEITGPLYKTVLSKEDTRCFQLWNSRSAVPFSVSTLANILAIVFIGLFCVLLFVSAGTLSIELIPFFAMPAIPHEAKMAVAIGCIVVLVVLFGIHCFFSSFAKMESPTSSKGTRLVLTRRIVE